MNPELNDLQKRITALAYEYRLRSCIHGPDSESAQSKAAELADAKNRRMELKRQIAERSGRLVLA